MKARELQSLLLRLKRRFYKTSFVYQADIKSITRKESDPRYRTLPLTEASVEQLRSCYPEEFTARKQAIFQKYLQDDTLRGSIIVGENDQILGYLWSAVDTFYEGSTNYTGTLRPDEFYLFDLYTFRTHRKKGAMQAGVVLEVRYYEQSGYHTVRALISDYNHPSISMMEGLGFQKTGKIYSFTHRGKTRIREVKNL